MLARATLASRPSETCSNRSARYAHYRFGTDNGPEFGPTEGDPVVWFSFPVVRMLSNVDKSLMVFWSAHGQL